MSRPVLGWAGVSATLSSDVKSVSSAYAAFAASGNMYCSVTWTSQYPIKFEAYSRDTATGYATRRGKTIYNVGASGNTTIDPTGNFHMIKLTGWNIESAVKHCIG